MRSNSDAGSDVEQRAGGRGSRSADEVIAALAVRQHGIVTRMQLLREGAPRHVVDCRARTGRLRSVHTGVYQVGPVVAPRAREMAAALACDGTVSHFSAAAMLDWLPAQLADAPVDVTIARGRHRGRREGIRAHRSDLAEDEIIRIDGLPVTSPARTLLDLSGVVSRRQLERCLASAERVSPSARSEVLALLNRHAGRSGTRRLRDLLASSGAPARTRSEAEERLLALIRKGGLPEPAMNVPVHGFEVDCFWSRARLVIEVDGYAYHASARAFLRDRQRDTALAAAGIQVLRLSWEQLAKNPEKTLVHLAQALAHARG